MLAVLGAGVGAGAVNAAVGSGTLITFPVLLATGLPPVTATVSNALGLIPGPISGAIGYRRELSGQGRRVLKLSVGAPSAVSRVRRSCRPCPPRRSRGSCRSWWPSLWSWWSSSPGSAEACGGAGNRPAHPSVPTAGHCCSPDWRWPSTYGGYFAAAQGIVYLSLMGVLLDDSMQRLNAVKNVLVAVVNAVAAMFFLVMADFDWTAVALLAVGSAAGGQVGARSGRRLSPAVLRTLIVVVGTAGIVHLLR